MKKQLELDVTKSKYVQINEFNMMAEMGVIENPYITVTYFGNYAINFKFIGSEIDGAICSQQNKKTVRAFRTLDTAKEVIRMAGFERFTVIL